MRFLLLLPLFACSAYNAADPNDVASSVPTTDDTGEPPVVEEGWATFDGRVDIAGGVPTATQITLGLWEKDSIGQPSLSCSAELHAEAPTVITAPPDEVEPYVMWQLSTANDSCLGTEDLVALGIGPLPRELWPAAEFEGVSVRQSRGLYTVWDGRLVVFGLAGTQAQLQGRGAPTTLDPLPDGTYELVSAYLLEL